MKANGVPPRPNSDGLGWALCLTATGRKYNAFQMRIRSPFVVLLLGLPLFGFHLPFVYAEALPAPSVVTIDGLGKGTVDLSGPWRFHIGDDLHWAEPGFNDTPGENGWESILADRPWGAQGHYAYTGFAWYRLNLRVTPAPEVKTDFQLLLPRLEDACEVYWNGRLVGRYGELPPHPSSPVVNAPAAFTLPDIRSGTLAIRVWKRPLGSSAAGGGGGIAGTPLVGDAKSIADYIGTWNYQFLRGTLYFNARNILYFIVALAAFVLWLRRRSETLLLWFSIFAICPAIWTAVYTMRLPVSSEFSQFLLQPLWALRNVALWFLLIELLYLRSRHGLVRWAKILAVVSLTGSFLDGCLTYVPVDWISPQTSAWIDGILTVFIAPCELYLLVLVANGFRQKLDSARWVLALSASLSQLLAVIVATARQGQRFTHWTLSDHLSSSLFHLGPVSFNADTLLDLLVFLSIIYTVYHYIRDQQDRKTILEQELHSARELQQVLIPERLPTLPGFSVSSAYRPALEVGGDFFQIIPLDGRTPDRHSSSSATSAGRAFAPRWPCRSLWVLCARSQKLPPGRLKFSLASAVACTAVLKVASRLALPCTSIPTALVPWPARATLRLTSTIKRLICLARYPWASILPPPMKRPSCSSILAIAALFILTVC
jgi:hypothetical protein